MGLRIAVTITGKRRMSEGRIMTPQTKKTNGTPEQSGYSTSSEDTKSVERVNPFGPCVESAGIIPRYVPSLSMPSYRPIVSSKNRAKSSAMLDTQRKITPNLSLRVQMKSMIVQIWECPPVAHTRATAGGGARPPQSATAPQFA